MIFPEIFLTGEAEYHEGEDGTMKAIADGLSGWACVMAGADIPEKFGEGMASIAIKIGGPATPEDLSRLADKYISKKEAV